MCGHGEHHGHQGCGREAHGTGQECGPWECGERHAFHPHHHAGACCCAPHRDPWGRERAFSRRFATREERIAWLEQYLRELRAEAQAVEERIAEMKAK